MRTLKGLVCLAVLAGGIATTLAQSNVYSLNVVGYYNITIGAKQKIIIANQLNTTNNTIGALLTAPMVNNNDTLFKYAGGFSAAQFQEDNTWDNPQFTLNPGEAAFYINQQATTETLTFVGEVLQGQLVNTLPLGTKVMRSSMVPQQGKISTDLGVVGDNNDNLFTFNTGQSSGGYTAYQFQEDNTWDTEPVINVGQGFFYIKQATANPANANWIRNFTVQ